MRTPFIYNLVLTFVWVALTGSFNLVNVGFGFVLGYFMLRVALGQAAARYFLFIPRLLGFTVYFLRELVKANWQVAVDVITPPFYMTPGIVAVPLSAKTDAEITLLANLITLTPGTLSLDVSDDRSHLYIHVMYLKDEAAFIDEIKNGFEMRLLKLMR